MRKKYILIIIFLLILTSLIVVIINKNTEEYIMQDGIMLALTLDGETIDSYPEGKNYFVDIDCENGVGTWLVEEWKLAVEEVTGNVVCNIDFTSSPKTLKVETESKATTRSNGYRYSGKQPNNWVWFNNEMWRIIGSVPVCLDSTCSTSETLVKIIRANTIGSLMFNRSIASTNSWGNNSLTRTLNSYYYGKKDATITECNSSSLGFSLCNYTDIGILSTNYYGKMLKNVYWNIGEVSSSNASKTLANIYNLEKSTLTSSSYRIGLMSASDFGYASGQTSITMGDLTSYEQNNWLYNYSYEWTITPRNYETVYFIGLEGGVSAGTVNMGYFVRPVVYLDSSVYVVSGDGTEANPYQIAM